MKASICMASFNRNPDTLRAVLTSIYAQSPPFDFEVIIADDGSVSGAPQVRGEFPLEYHRIEREPVARCPAIARNVAYKAAKGDIIIAQSDDVLHETPNAIERLCVLLEEHPQTFVLANVVGLNSTGERTAVYSGPYGRGRRPYFFLGALWKHDLYAIGGDDEDFTISGGTNYEDKWFAQCLMNGRGLSPLYAEPGDVSGVHQYHETRWNPERTNINWQVYKTKIRSARKTGLWCAGSGPWNGDA